MSARLPPNALASEGQATIITRPLDDGYLADVHLLALSSHRPGFRTKLGHEMDPRSWAKKPSSSFLFAIPMSRAR